MEPYESWMMLETAWLNVCLSIMLGINNKMNHTGYLFFFRMEIRFINLSKRELDQKFLTVEIIYGSIYIRLLLDIWVGKISKDRFFLIYYPCNSLYPLLLHRTLLTLVHRHLSTFTFYSDHRIIICFRKPRAQFLLYLEQTSSIQDWHPKRLDEIRADAP